MKWSACFKAYFTALALALCLSLPGTAAVADEKGFSLVIYKNSVALGGTDITLDVLQKLKK